MPMAILETDEENRFDPARQTMADHICGDPDLPDRFGLCMDACAYWRHPDDFRHFAFDLQ